MSDLSKSFPIAHCRVHHLSHSGPPLVLFHGVTRCWQTFLPLIPALTSRWSVFGVDQRGHGLSPQEPAIDDFRVAAFIRDAVELITALPFPKVSLYGHSLGAMVALGVAAAVPEKIAGIVLEDPPFHTMGDRLPTTRLASYFQGLCRLLHRRPTLEQLLAEMPELEYVDPISGESTKLREVRDEGAIRFSAWCLTQVDPRILDSVVANRWLEGFDWQQAANQVRIPRLVLQADPKAGGMLTDDDALVLTQSTNSRPPCDGGAHRICWPGVGHTIHEARPAELAARVLSFLETIRETC